MRLCAGEGESGGDLLMTLRQQMCVESEELQRTGGGDLGEWCQRRQCEWAGPSGLTVSLAARSSGRKTSTT